MQVLFISLIAFCNVFSHSADKVKIVADRASSSIVYALHHPLHAFDAAANEFRCVAVYNTESRQLELIAANVTVSSFDSGNSNRDSHMVEATEALKYTSVTFSSDKIEYDGDTVKAEGVLVFHGVKKTLTIVGKQNMGKNLLVLKGAFGVDMTEYGIEQPSIMGMKTDKEIEINFTFSFRL